LPIILKQIEEMLKEMGENGTDLLEQYLSKRDG
jgi:hypothetical protein